MPQTATQPGFQPPSPRPDESRVTLAHGEGARLSRQLVREQIVARLGNSILNALGDAAVLPPLNGPGVLTTDSFVVAPLFFPGGDIGKLAVYGTVNDLVVTGARPRWLSLAMILEEGLPFDTLGRVLESVAAAARAAEVMIVAGDTKVVPRGAVDQLFITTTGLGELIEPAPPGPAAIVAGDEMVVSGPVGRHGIAVLAAREELGFDPPPTSDCGNLFEALQALRDAGIPIRAARDATRGGVVSVLHEWADTCGVTLLVEESQVPVTDEIRGACELLGLDPLYVACEGTLVAMVPAGFGSDAVAALRTTSIAAGAALLGQAVPLATSRVVIRRMMGRVQPLDAPTGILLPRIC